MPFSFQQRQTQRQTATPAMLMESVLLQLPIGELAEEVRKEVSANPALEISGMPAGRVALSGTGGGDPGWIENIADGRGETLDEHLVGELRMDGVKGRELDLCRAIVAELDSDGRFRGELPSMMMAVGATLEELESARRRVMQIDPKGCAAKDLSECYAAQLGSVSEKMRPAVQKALQEISRSGSGTSSFSFSGEVVAELKKLNPFPGRLFDRRRNDCVLPDITVDADGEVSVDQGDVPEIRVSAKYVAMAGDPDLDEETRRFAADRVRRARSFADALARRRETMERIAVVTVTRQLGFVRSGEAELKKLTMGDVAREAGCTVSTVSRAASRKFVKTPRGVIALRRFFSLCDGAPLEALKEILRSGGAPAKSDRQLSEEMARKGFKMARRTVAKYRSILLKNGSLG